MGFVIYLLLISEFLLKLSLLSLRFGQSLFLLTGLVLQSRDPCCKTK